MAYAGKDLLIYKNDIVDVFDRMLDGCISVTGYNSFASCFCNFVHSLVEKYPIGFSSHATKYWYDETFLREAHLHWGEKVDKNNLDIDWHITTLEESEFAWEVVKKYSDRSIQELSTLMMLPTDTDVQKQETYHQVSKWIVILQSCICSCLLMVKPIRYDLPTASAYSYIFSTPDVECAWAVDENHPLYNEIYANIEQMYRLLKKVLEYLLAKTPDNTDSLFNMITAIEASVTFKYYLQQELVIVKSMKPLQMIPADGTVFCRPIRMSESYALLLKRKYYSRRQGGICPARMDLIHSLLKLSVCQYTEVRKYAQTSLSRCIGDYLYLCKPITDEIVILLETLTDHDALKGCLFVLQNTAILEFLSLTRDHYYKVSLALIRLRNQTGLKDAIFELIDSLLQSIAQRLDFSTDDIVIPEIIKEEAKLIEVDLGTVGILERYREERVKLLETLLNDYVTNLVEIANTDIHWSIAVHIGYLFFLMIQAKRPIPAGIAEFAFRNLNNEHLQIRDQSMVLCNEIFTVMKRRSKLLGEFRGNEIKKVMDPASKEFQSIDLLWHKNREPIFIDKTLPGWIIYSNPTKVFTGFIDGQPYTDSESADVFPIFERYLTDDDFWNDFFRLASLETDAEEPEFNYDIAQFLTGIFTLYQTKYLEKVIPHLRILLNKTTEVASQKSCAETICGIFFGSKHFPKHQKEILVKQLLPLLSQGIVESSIEGLYFWKEAISALFSTGRDPKRYLDLVELLQLELEKYDASLSYIRQTKKVSFVNIILSSPQVPKEFYEKCLSLYLGMGTNPYQQVRESLGSGIDFALTGLSRPYDPNYATVEKLFHRKDWTSLPNRIILDFLDHNLVENIPIPGKQFNSNVAKLSILNLT
jgi:hypothetical protein